jgi:hypothetical protein
VFDSLETSINSTNSDLNYVTSVSSSAIKMPTASGSEVSTVKEISEKTKSKIPISSRQCYSLRNLPRINYNENKK